ncbi:MAG: dUTP diphosphatase [Planctomycetota bacterium]
MNPNPELLVKLLSPRATLPAYQSAGAAGLDLSACLPAETESLTIRPGEILLVPTGLAIAVPPGFEGQVRARSGLATKHGIGLPNAPGTIDSDYRGELKVAVINFSTKPFEITHALRIAQLVVAPVAKADIRVVSDLGETTRGAGGFGSTGLSSTIEVRGGTALQSGVPGATTLQGGDAVSPKGAGPAPLTSR